MVGVGSVGTRAWILLLVGKDNDDPLILQAKEAEASVLEEFVGKSGYANHGARVVAGQHLMQASSDIFLGYASGRRARRRATGTSTYASSGTGRAASRSKGQSPRASPSTSPVCAQALARAHARSGDRIAIASYLGNGPTFDRALAEFAASVRRPERARLRGSPEGGIDGADHRRVRPVGPRPTTSGTGLVGALNRTGNFGGSNPRREDGADAFPQAVPT